MLALKEGRYDVYSVNPPLIKDLVAIPLVLSRPVLSQEVLEGNSSGWMAKHDQFIHDNPEDYQELIFRCRYMLVGLSILGGWIIYCWSSQLFGPIGGLISLSLWCFSPNVLTWAGVCTSDLAPPSLPSAPFTLCALTYITLSGRRPW